MNFLDTIEYISGFFEDNIAWDLIESFFSGKSFHAFSEMRNTFQNPIFHGEGDVYTHTQMVCRELLKMPDFKILPEHNQTELFIAALLHDTGKVKTTRIEDGVFVSPKHSLIGSHIVREFLWKECNFSGTPEKQNFRETICSLIRYHMLPVHLIEYENPQVKAMMTASIRELAHDFSLNLLRMLSEADVKGRIAYDIDEELYRVQLFKMIAEESQCLYNSYSFADKFTEHACFSGRNVQPDQVLYNDTWGEVIMMSGLPGTGKDTWISMNAPDMPVISLDEIRKELRIKPTDEQGAVIHTAQERAKELLRKKQPFIWNATDITRDIRQKWIMLFERYNAGVRIVYLETDYDTLLKRNSERENVVPEIAIEKMLGKLSPPTPEEAEIVEWHCV